MYPTQVLPFNDAISDSDLTTEEFETAFKLFIRNKVADVDTINSDIVLDTYDMHVQQYLWLSTRFYSRLLLFLIYFNDLLQKASSVLKPVMFADNTNLLLSNKDILKTI